MSYKSTYDKGDWKAICDVCGRLFKAHKLKKRWDGLMTCNKDWEVRQPQDFVRGKADIQAPKWTRPSSEDVFTPDAICGILESTAIPNLGQPGCMIPATIVPSWYVSIPTSTFTV